MKMEQNSAGIGWEAEDREEPMLEKVVRTSLAALTISGATLAMDVTASSQAMDHSIGHYSGERMHSEFWREHYRHFSNEDHDHDDIQATEFDQPIGEGVR
jgi:hypothetical protein